MIQLAVSYMYTLRPWCFAPDEFYSLLININQPMVVDVIVFQVPKTPTLRLYISQTAQWIEMKLKPSGSSCKNL